MSNSPTLTAYGEAREGRRKMTLVPVGVGWHHEKGNGCTIQMDALPLHFNGRIVLLDDRTRDLGKDGGQ